MSVVAWLDLVGIVAWSMAAAVILVRWRSPGPRSLRPAMLGIAGFSALYCGCMFAEWSGLSTQLEWLEDLVGATLPMWWVLLLLSVEHRIHVQTVERHDQRLRSVFEQTFQLVGLLAVDGTVLLANKTALAFVNDSAGDNVGKPFWETSWWAHSESLQARVRDAVSAAASGVFVRFEATHVDAQQRLRNIDFSLRPMLDANQRVMGLIAEGRDVTKLKEAEVERRRLHEELLQAQKMEIVGQLASGVAHDFNNLLTVVSASADLLRDQVEGVEGTQEAMEAIDGAVEQGAALARSLLTFGRQGTWRKRATDLAAVVLTVEKLLRRVLPRDIELEVAVPRGRACWIEADDAEIQQMILNLTINARDAMPRGGRLRVCLEARDAGGERRFVLTVKDDGVGIPQELQERVYEPFFTTKALGQGTGLGLTVVRRVVASHRAELSLESELGRGTTFEIAFEALPEPESVGPPEVSRELPPQGLQHLLLISDDVLARRVVAAQLRTLGYEVTVREHSAAPWTGSTVPDGLAHIVVDGDGIRVGDAAPERWLQGATVPVVLLTGGGADWEIAEEPERLRVLRKPFRTSELRRALEEMTRHKGLSESVG